MQPDTEALRAILKQYISAAYDRALRNTGDEAAARQATRRTMELLKRACLDGVEPNKALVLRITDDCCDESAFFNRQVEAEAARRSLRREEETAGEAPIEPADKPMPDIAVPAPATAAPAPRNRVVRTRQAQPAPAAPRVSRIARTSQATAAPLALSMEPEPEAPDLFPADESPAGRRKRRRKGGVSPASALLAMFLCLLIVGLVVALVIMLSANGALPSRLSQLAADFSGWFNAHIFPLF